MNSHVEQNNCGVIIIVDFYLYRNRCNVYITYTILIFFWRKIIKYISQEHAHEFEITFWIYLSVNGCFYLLQICKLFHSIYKFRTEEISLFLFHILY